MTKFLSPEGVRGETGNAAGDNPFHVDFSPRKGDFRGNSTRSLRVAPSAKPRSPLLPNAQLQGDSSCQRPVH